MTVYTKSMMEALAEVRDIQEDNMDLMRKAAGGAMQTIKMKDGKLKMDSFTASALMQVYDKVNPKNKKAMEQIINSGKRAQMVKLQSIAMKAIKSENDPEIEEEVELDEAKYDLYHKDFSSAMQHAYKMAKKLHGITVKSSEIDDKVASGPRKPSEGKTNKYRLEGDKGSIQVQVYNKGGSKPFELNMYKEESELEEGDPFMGPTKGKDKVVMVRHKTSGKELEVTANSVKKYEKMGYKVVKETTEIGERVAEQLARIKGSTSLDEAKGTTKYVVMQGPGDNNQKVIVTFDGGAKALEKAKKFRDDWNKKNKSKIKLDKKGKPIAAHMARIFAKGAETSYKVGDKVSYSAFAPSIVKEEVELEEGRMKELHGYIAQGKSAEWIAKKMGVDVKTIKSLMDEYGEVDEASARADAMKAMSKGRKVDPADVDTDATDADIKAASKNILAQMRKAVSLGGRFDVEFLDKKKVRVKPAIANAFIRKYEGMRRPADKEKFQNQAMKSYKDMLKVLKAGYMMKAAYEEVEIDEVFNGTKQDIRKITRATDNALRKRSAQIQKMLKSKTNEKGKGLTDFEFDHISDEGDAIAAELVYRKKGGKDPTSDAIPSHLKKFVNEEVELDEGKAKYTRKLMKNKSIVDYVKKQQEKNRKDVAKFGNKKVGAFGNEPRFDSGSGWLDMASDEVKQNRMSDNKRRAFDAEAEYEAIARKLGLDKFEPKLEEVELDEALPSHLKKHFDKDGNPKSKEGKAAWERLAKMKGYKKYTSKQIKMAVGIAFDKRFVQGNMTGAVNAIEKIAKGLSEIEPVRNALRRANENTILDRIDRKLKERKNG